MTNIVIYTKDYCPYCKRAKDLLTRKGQSFEEIEVINEKIQEEMIARAGGQRTVPQIFINDKHIGGCDDLYALDRDDALDGLLAA